MDIDTAWLEEHIFHRPLSSDEKSVLRISIVALQFSKNDHLLSEGDEADGLCFLHSGRAGVHHHSHGQQVRVGEVEEGAQLGDMAFFDGDPYSTTIMAKSDCVVYKIPQSKLEALMAEQHEMAKDIMLNTICRLSGIVRGMNSVNAYSKQYIQGHGRTSR